MPNAPPLMHKRERATRRERGYLNTGTDYRKQCQAWYSSRRWKARRADQLKREPLCWMCRRDGHATPATIADHDPPHRGDENAFWTGPLRSLCKPHHDSDKALIEAGRPKVRTGADGWPIEP